MTALSLQKNIQAVREGQKYFAGKFQSIWKYFLTSPRKNGSTSNARVEVGILMSSHPLLLKIRTDLIIVALPTHEIPLVILEGGLFWSCL